MDELRLRILTDGRNLGNGILKVDGFINHQVDPNLMDACGRELAQRFGPVAPTKGRAVELVRSPEYLGREERVLIIDDFLATGQTIMGLVRLAQAAGATVVGGGGLVEKRCEGGRG